MADGATREIEALGLQAQPDGTVLVPRDKAQAVIRAMMSSEQLGAALVACGFSDVKAVKILWDIAKFGDDGAKQIAAIREIRRWIEATAKASGLVVEAKKTVTRSASGTTAEMTVIERQLSRALEGGHPDATADFIALPPGSGGLAPDESEDGAAAEDDE